MRKGTLAFLALVIGSRYVTAANHHLLEEGFFARNNRAGDSRKHTNVLRLEETPQRVWAGGALEGRIAVADGVHYAEHEGPKHVD